MHEHDLKPDEIEDVGDSEPPCHSPSIPPDYDEYIADMILELQQLASRTGRHALAARLLAAYEIARRN
ncbi:MAG: hypothetical protein K0U74_01660 [Alphaproteobacteria bacterium]|nr:hypothetical protein [Alphaproteobacteria bacterium]